MENRQQNLGYLLSRASRLLKWKFNHTLSEFGLTAAQWSVIKDLSMQEDRCTDDLQKLSPAAVAERLYLDRPTISGILERTIQNGWLRREENPHDRRSQVIRLTEKSRAVVSHLTRLGNEATELAVRGFSEEEITELKSLLARMADNLTGEDI